MPIGIFLQPGANALEVGDAVRARLAELIKSAPPGFEFSVPYDTTKFVRVSIVEVLKTLGESMALVFAVVFLFLQNWRATLIPMLAVPVSLIGTFTAMLLFGFSINTLTLFGMVLSIGIVVDDAIVVLENVERIIAEERLSPREATIKAMEQVTGPVIAIVFVLTAVFLPVAFLGGLVGEMYRQFAVTIAVSVAISGFVALTLSPALCAALLREEPEARHCVLPALQRLVRAHDRTLLRRRAPADAPRRAFLRAVRRDAGRDRGAVPPGAGFARADRGPGLRACDPACCRTPRRSSAPRRRPTSSREVLLAHPAVDGCHLLRWNRRADLRLSDERGRGLGGARRMARIATAPICRRARSSVTRSARARRSATR